MTLRLILLIVILPTLKNTYSQSYFKVHWKSIDLIYNDHVGNEWSYEVILEYANTQYKLRQNKELQISYVKGVRNLIIKTYLREDEEYPDISTETEIIDLKKIQSEYLEIIIPSIVIEDRSRYKGNKAKWKFNIHLQIH